MLSIFVYTVKIAHIGSKGTPIDRKLTKEIRYGSQKTSYLAKSFHG